MSSSEFLPFITARLWAQNIPCLCYHPCSAHMSHLPPSFLLYITYALTSSPRINFFLLLILIGTSEVTACSSNTENIGFTSVVGRTILPLAQLHTLPSLQSGWAWWDLLLHTGQLICLCCSHVWQEQTEGRSMPMWKVLGWTCQQATPTPTKPSQMADTFSF